MEAIKESMAQMNTVFLKKLAEFEDKQKQISKTAPPSPSCDNNLEAEFSVFKEFTLNALRTLQNQVELLAQQNDNLEMHTRRKILLLHGVAEGKSEDTMSAIVEVVSRTLKIKDFSANNVSRCHRMGASVASGRPRPILFKVSDVSLRSKIWAAKTLLKGSGKTLSEFLTKTRHDTFMTARQRFGVTKCWTRDGSVYVLGADGTRHRVSTVAELDRIAEPAMATCVAAANLPTVKEPTSHRSKRPQTQKSKFVISK